MISERTYKKIKRKLDIMDNVKNTEKDRTDLEDRLDLVLTILDPDILALNKFSDYKEYCERKGEEKPIYSLFATYLFPESSDNGIINNLSNMFRQLSNFQEDDLADTIKKTKEDLEESSQKLEEAVKKENSLFESIKELKKKRELLEEKNQKYNSEMQNYNTLNEYVQSLEKKIEEYENNKMVIPVENLQERANELNKQYEKIKKDLEERDDIIFYYKKIKEIVDAYNIAKELESLQGVMSAYNDDRKALDSIEKRKLMQNINVIKGIRDKIDPLRDSFNEELGKIIAELTKE